MDATSPFGVFIWSRNRVWSWFRLKRGTSIKREPNCGSILDQSSQFAVLGIEENLIRAWMSRTSARVIQACPQGEIFDNFFFFFFEWPERGTKILILMKIS
jgi:hypothetical protein